MKYSTDFVYKQFWYFSWRKKADANYQTRMGPPSASLQPSHACYEPVSLFPSNTSTNTVSLSLLK